MMKMLLRRSLALAGLPALAASAARALPAQPERFVVYYANQASLPAFAPYRWAVLDSDFHPPLQPLAAQGSTTFGYLSAGEAERNRTHFAAIAPGVLLDENPNWPGSFYADVRRPEWRALVLDHL